MALASIPAAGLHGINAYPIEVEVDIRFGLPSWTTVGLAEGAVKESRDRVTAAIKNSGYQFERQKITINLSPADIKKQGTAYDLPIAIGLMAASELLEIPQIHDKVFLGELCLDGRIKPVPGALPIAVMARQLGRNHVILPEDNAREASVVTGLTLSPVKTLDQVVQALTGENDFPIYREKSKSDTNVLTYKKDYLDIKGQFQARRAIEIAVAGGHNIIMIGPPGSGKTMLAERIPSILPPMSLDESLSTTKIYSVVGKLDPEEPLIRERPCRAPHHSISTAGLIGGGSVPRPGEVSFAHNGVLFLDELPEFQRHVMELLRQPLESGRVTIARALTTLTYPASFMLVAAMNPCKCGYLGSPIRSCRCTLYDRTQYRNRISGPIVDRIDLHIEVPALSYEELSQKKPGEPSAAIAKRVLLARKRQSERFGPRGVHCNAKMMVRQLRQFCQMNQKSQTLMKNAVNNLGLSARAYDRILKVARTISDLEGTEGINESHIAEAIQYRTLDREESL
jgi:magnesium chelatase family protein